MPVKDLGTSGTEDNGSRGWSNASTRVSGGACSCVSSRVSVDDCLRTSDIVIFNFDRRFIRLA